MKLRRLTRTFQSLQEAGRKALVVYLTAGDSTVDVSVAAALAAVKAGADILEIGIPFSDPVADGPVIQRAMLRSLERGGGFQQALEVIKRIRATVDVPLVAFGYANPLLWDGLDKSCGALHAAGADGLLIVDIPSEEAAPMREAVAKAGLDWVPLVAPTTGEQRAATIAAQGTGFIYMVSMTGVTGGALANTGRLEPIIAATRAATEVPICIGFGVRDKESARRAAALGDGVVVGSAVVARLEAGEADGTGPAKVAELVRELRAGVDGT